MYYFQKKSMPQIASELELNISTVSRTLNRARQNLQVKTTAAVTAKKLLTGGALDLSEAETAKAVLLALSPAQAVYFFLCYSEGLSAAKIGVLTKKLRSTVARTLDRARQNIGILFGEQSVSFQHPEALDNLAYQTYLQIADRLEDILSESPAPNIPPARNFMQGGHGPIQIQEAAQGEAPGKLLTALSQRVDGQGEFTMFQYLEAVFSVLQAKLKEGECT